MMPISFTASYICNANIKYNNRKNKQVDKEIAIVELDKSSENDRNAIFKAAMLWDRPCTQNYAWNVYNRMECNKFDEVEKEHFIALTSQKDDYDKLDYKKILGVTQFSELYRDENSIDWFQVKPLYNYVSSKNHRKYSHVGDQMIKYIIQNYHNKPIYVSSAEEAIEFYEKYGFKSEDNSEFEMVYET